MFTKYLLIIIATTATVLSSPRDLRLLFPQDKQYVYEITASTSSGTLTPDEASTSWTLEGRLFAQVLGNESQVRFQLGDLKTSVASGNDGYISYKVEEAAEYLKLPWILDYYKEFCLVEAIYLPSEPAWVSNIKRALSLNFQLKNGDVFYTNYEPCVHDHSCFTTYFSQGNTVRKYSSLPSSPKLGASWKSVPWMDPVYKYDQYLWSNLPDITTMTAERVYKLDDKSGLMKMEMKGKMKYRSEGHSLFVNTDLDIQYETEHHAARLDWPKLTRSSVKYSREDCEDPSCGIRDSSQGFLRNRTYEILLKISRKGIDADNIVKDPTMVHSIDFINLLNTISLLNYTTLKALFEDLVVGTSYELETSRNIFLEVVPYAGTEASVKFVKYLVVEQSAKIEDSALLSLIRKLPFNNANYSQHLLEELEPFTKLGLDFPQEIRHAAILSFGTMLYQAKKGERVGPDYFDNMVVKYLRMYSDCPHYMDRLVWLQGLCNIGGPTQKYTMEIYTDPTKKRNERLWAAFASDYIDNQYYMSEPLKTTEILVPVLMNETENVQIRMAALHSFLAATAITQNDFLYVHNYVTTSGSPQMKRFWYTALKSLETNRNFDGYKLASLFLPSVSDMVFDLDPEQWATNNVIFRSEDDPTTSVHFLSMADDTGLPAFAGVRLATGGKRASVYVVAEGVAPNIYKRMHAFEDDQVEIDTLIDILKDLRVWAVKSTEEVHVDFVFKVNEKTVFVAHLNQSRFDSWNLLELAKSVNEFLRLGSHINQQIVYYPSHMELMFPSELGIPVRLQTTSMSFTSVRGNLTAPATDIHVRYQGMSLTSLSTFGPLVQSEHSARIQKSMVAHLPVKFNISHAPVGVYNLKTDFMLPIQNGGVVIHTRTQVEKNTKEGIDLYSAKIHSQGSATFSDCENSTYDSSIQDLFTANVYSVLKFLQPSKLILKAVPLMVSPPSSSCRVIHLHNLALLDANIGVKATLLIENLPSIVDFFSGRKNVFKATLLLRDYRQDTEASGELLNLEFDLETQKHDNNILTKLQLIKPANEHHEKIFQGYIENYDYFYIDDLDSTLESKYKTHFSLGGYTASDERHPSWDFFVVAEKDRSGEKRMSVRVIHDTVWKYALFDVLREIRRRKTKGSAVELPQDIWVPLYFATITEPKPAPHPQSSTTEISAVLKDGLASVAVNGSAMAFKSSEIEWWVDNWFTLKKMATFGLYKTCRIEGVQAHTLFGYDRTIKQNPEDAVALADCTNVPRFAVLSQKSGGLRVYDGSHYVSLRVDKGVVVWTANGAEAGSHLIVKDIGGGLNVRTRSGVHVSFRADRTSIFVPDFLLDTVCGVCAGRGDV